jgi:hypothetical protein
MPCVHAYLLLHVAVWYSWTCRCGSRPVPSCCFWPTPPASLQPPWPRRRRRRLPPSRSRRPCRSAHRPQYRSRRRTSWSCCWAAGARAVLPRPRRRRLLCLVRADGVVWTICLAHLRPRRCRQRHTRKHRLQAEHHHCRLSPLTLPVRFSPAPPRSGVSRLTPVLRRGSWASCAAAAACCAALRQRRPAGRVWGRGAHGGRQH